MGAAAKWSVTTAAALVAGAALIGSASPPPPRSGATAWDGSGAAPVRCPARFDLEQLRGRCVFGAQGRGVRLAVAGMTGRMPLGRCEMSFTFHVRSDAEVAMDVRFNGPNPCGDVQSCTSPTTGSKRPWRGRLGVGGSLPVRVCLDTCVGIFRGALRLRLERGASGRLLRIEPQYLGTSGFWIAGNAQIDVAPSRALILRGSRGGNDE